MDGSVLIWLAIGIAVAAGSWAWLRQHRAAGETQPRALDTVGGWPPEVTRVLTAHERKAFATLMRALPDYMVLAQVPLSRFLKVPRRHSYGEWLNRVGYLSADLLVCDKSSQVLAVVEVHSPRDSERSKLRHERMARVLKAAQVRCVVWMENAIPDPDSAREQLLPKQAPAPVPAEPAATATMSSLPAVNPGAAAIPIGDTEEVDLDLGPLREPAPSTWFDELDAEQPPSPGPKR